MNIKRIAVRKENLELTRPYTIAYKTTSHVENMVVVLELDNGIHAIGTCNPSHYVVGESLEDSERILTHAENVEWLVGRDIRTIHRLCSEVSTRFPVTPGVRAALDIVLWDAFTKWLGVPLVEFLGREVESLPTSITIGIKNVAETLAEAKEYIERKFTVLKVKTGESLEEDVERLTKLREVHGSSITIRIDSNQGYNAAQMIEFFERTRKLNIELNEQPIPVSALEDMRLLPEEIRRTIAADETLISPKDALNLVQKPAACGIFNVKLMKCGGVSKGLEIARIAENAGVELMWGCNDESIVSITAALHTAFSSANTKYIDLDGSLDLARDVVTDGFILENGIMRPNDKPGLGVEIV